jgi:hypothetical protein
MKKKFDWHIWLLQEVDLNTKNLFYFRHDNDDENYECEQYVYSDNQVLDLKYGESSKEYFDKVMSLPNIRGTHPSVYFGLKGMSWKSFGEDHSIEK